MIIDRSLKCFEIVGQQVMAIFICIKLPVIAFVHYDNYPCLKVREFGQLDAPYYLWGDDRVCSIISHFLH